ncbi:MarR family winged helix-turn-helix transcriptional regulator [Pararhodobacter zhoushanensis]|uniref:MarR family winged helix-turn-helix transcriptional regulator n=1 Tax=Pararhodobacter zhoushanensis TaxID=2479545 RepID=A0ABT3GU31_9RHOB|nr:MarR family winged helix-turn-helix transcriptional regulator [Pararhodobacter zhoushanensis]MCW1931047.1 MarR family winged helix-turn-helix transcriptional regulator [Pararhodobacter zhoushanensis]
MRSPRLVQHTHKCLCCTQADRVGVKGETVRAKEIYSQPGYLFRRMHQVSTAAFSAVETEKPLTPVQFAALLTIRDNPGIDATRLASAIRFDRTTIGHVIGRLEIKGLIIRNEGSLDKRTKLLRITAEGSMLLDSVGPRVGEIAEIILAPLKESERVELMRMLTLLDAAANQDVVDGEA